MIQLKFEEDLVHIVGTLHEGQMPYSLTHDADIGLCPHDSDSGLYHLITQADIGANRPIKEDYRLYIGTATEMEEAPLKGMQNSTPYSIRQIFSFNFQGKKMDLLILPNANRYIECASNQTLQIEGDTHNVTLEALRGT